MDEENKFLTRYFSSIVSLKSYWKYEYYYEGSYESYTWSPTTGYTNESSDTPPWRLTGMGPYNGVLLVADSHPKHFKNHCNVSDYGLTVRSCNKVSFFLSFDTISCSHINQTRLLERNGGNII